MTLAKSSLPLLVLVVTLEMTCIGIVSATQAAPVSETQQAGLSSEGYDTASGRTLSHSQFARLPASNRRALLVEAREAKDRRMLGVARRALRDRDPAVRAAAATALATLGHRPSQARLRKWIGDNARTAEERVAAIWAVARVRDGRSSQPLAAVASNPADDRNVRKAALAALATQLAPPADEALVEEAVLRCLVDRDSGVVLNAIMATRERRITTAVSALVRLLHDPGKPDFIRIHAAWALAGISDPASYAALNRALDMPDGFIAANVARYMATSGLPIPQEALQRVLGRVAGDAFLTRMLDAAAETSGATR